MGFLEDWTRQILIAAGVYPTYILYVYTKLSLKTWKIKFTTSIISGGGVSRIFFTAALSFAARFFFFLYINNLLRWRYRSRNVICFFLPLLTLAILRFYQARKRKKNIQPHSVKLAIPVLLGFQIESGKQFFALSELIYACSFLKNECLRFFRQMLSSSSV